jgi:hypothetical protein
MMDNIYIDDEMSSKKSMNRGKKTKVNFSPFLSFFWVKKSVSNGIYIHKKFEGNKGEEAMGIKTD